MRNHHSRCCLNTNLYKKIDNTLEFNEKIVYSVICEGKNKMIVVQKNIMLTL